MSQQTDLPEIDPPAPSGPVGDIATIARHLDNSPLAVVEFDPGFRVRFWSRQATVLFGWRASDAVGRTLDDLRLVHPEDTEVVADVFARVLAGHDAYVSARNRNLAVDGRVVYCDWYNSVLRDRDGQAQSILSFALDVTPALEAEERLKLSEERFRLLARATNDTVWDHDLIADQVWRSEGFDQMLGLATSDEGTPTAWLDRIHPDDCARVSESYRDAIASHATHWEQEYLLRDNDGQYHAVVDRGHILRSADGTAVRMIGGVTDITARKRSEARFLHAQRLESLGTLAGGIAHDLNNVLTPIMMAVELLEAHVSDESGRSLVGTLRESARRGAAMVRQILAFARGADGRHDTVDPLAVLRDVEGLVRDSFPKAVTLVVDTPGSLAPVQGDPTQLHQVLMNLCVNARDAMPAGGILRLAAHDVLLDEASARAMPDAGAGAWVRFSVRDTGNGIPDNLQGRIFEPFFTTKAFGEGTGLGLSTSLAIVKGHGGFMQVDSQLGRGTTVEVYLPALAAGALAATGAARPVDMPVGGAGELLLVVDDEPSVREVTARTLVRHGYRVIVAANGAEALGRFAQHRGEIALVLTDMMMPVMDGPATILALRTMAPDVRIVAASGLASRGARGSAMHIDGAQAVIAKPFAVDVLLATLRRVLDAGAADGSTSQ